VKTQTSVDSGQRCALCNRRSPLVSSYLQLCSLCIRQRPHDARPLIDAAHTRARQEFAVAPPPDPSGADLSCPLCANHCFIQEGGLGYCGLRTVHHGRLVHLGGTPDRGLLHWYRDPLPTNCVAMDVCAGRGRPGFHNLAVFYGSCTLNCLFCQNWHFRDLLPSEAELSPHPFPDSLQSRWISAAELAAAANARTFCICYFGGDPASQMPHALASAAELARKGITVCWETNGTANRRLMDKAVTLSLQSCGTVKFDLKAHNEPLHRALTGVSNQQTLENFARAARRFAERPDPPLVIASTLLVPGYVDAQEVSSIADFIAGFSPDIPYVLLGFAPHFFMSDLPPTSKRHASEAEAAARAAGLTQVRIGNRHLLSSDY
jgi:pyruvate formate lyase activating enzyme